MLVHIGKGLALSGVDISFDPFVQNGNYFIPGQACLWDLSELTFDNLVLQNLLGVLGCFSLKLFLDFVVEKGNFTGPPQEELGQVVDQSLLAPRPEPHFSHPVEHVDKKEENYKVLSHSPEALSIEPLEEELIIS